MGVMAKEKPCNRLGNESRFYFLHQKRIPLGRGTFKKIVKTRYKPAVPKIETRPTVNHFSRSIRISQDRKRRKVAEKNPVQSIRKV
jgi:hypothetical protein